MSDRSPQQFLTLFSELVARLQRALQTSSEVPPVGLGLTPAGDVQLSLGVLNESSQLSAILNQIQAHLQELAASGAIEAVCIAYPDYAEQVVVANLENSEQYCIKYAVPVIETSAGLALDLEKIEVSDGSILVFGVALDADA